jgi:uncharacterized protein (TIGR03067 family)
MKKLLLTAAILLPLYLFSQSDSIQKENQFLKTRIDSLERKLDETNYTRVPNKDLDDHLGEMINTKVGSYISGKIALVSTIIGVISFLLGYLAKYFFSESTRKQIEDNVKKFSDKISSDNAETQSRLESMLQDQKEYINTNNRLNDDRIKDLGNRFDSFHSNIDNQLQQVTASTNRNIGDFQSNANARLKQSEDQMNKLMETMQQSLSTMKDAQQNYEKQAGENIEAKFSETFDFLWGDIIQGMIDRAVQKNYTGQSLVNDFEKILNKDLNVGVELKIKLIDTLMRCYFYTTDLPKRYEKMIELIKNYEDKYDLLPQTYVNASIALINNYELYGSADLRESALSNCDKSIQKDRDYGLPYAIKMEFLAIALAKVREDDIKKKIRHEIEELLYNISNIPSSLLKGEFLERLIQDKEIEYLKKYIDQLYSDYVKELTPFRENVMEQLVLNYSKTRDSEKKLFTNMLSEGIDNHPNLNGKWKVNSFIESGKSIDLQDQNMFLTLERSKYTINNSKGFEESGVIYFLPNLLPYSFSMIAEEKDKKIRVVKGIYTFDNSSKVLNMCINNPSQDRPVDLTSTPQNAYSLISLNPFS